MNNYEILSLVCKPGIGREDIKMSNKTIIRVVAEEMIKDSRISSKSFIYFNVEDWLWSNYIIVNTMTIYDLVTKFIQSEGE